MERIESPEDPRISDFKNIREAELARTSGVFIAEGTNVVRTLVLASHFSTRAVLIAERHLDSMREVVEKSPRTFVAEQEVLNAIAGFDLHRGCLASGERGSIPTADQLLDQLPPTSTILVLEELANHDNIGALFRNAAALGAKAILLDPRSADPLYRKAIRVSMGAALTVPFARLQPYPQSLETLKKRGFELWALTPAAGSESLERAAGGKISARIALLCGTEGAGLSKDALDRADRRVRIDIEEHVDSLNVATAAAIALYRVRVRG